MALRPEFALGHSEFNEFLFAAVGEEKNGMQLTVLSALTRLGFDAWGEAARLAALPEETATRALAAAIALLPEGDWTVSDAWTIATRLVHSLPKRGVQATQLVRDGTARGDRASKVAPARWLVGVALAAAMGLAVWHLQPTHAPELAPSVNSSTER